MSISGNIYERSPDPRYSEEKVDLYETNETPGDSMVRPGIEDVRGRNKILTKENTTVSETVETGEM